MKRKNLMITTMITLIFTGCVNTTSSEIGNEIDILVSTSIEETISSTKEELVCLDQRVFENGEPIQSISIIQKGSEQPRLLIKVTDKEEFYFDPPEQEYPKFFLNVYFADLNQDGIEEVVVSCFMGYYPGIYIIDIANHSYLIPPYATENGDPGSLGIRYKVYAVDEEHIQIKGGDFDSIIELSYDEIWNWNHEERITREEYFARYKEEAPEIGHAVDVRYASIEIVNYNNRSCLKLIQRLCGPWSISDHLGYMETIISWNSDGEYYIENTEYVKRDPISMSESKDAENSDNE